MEKAKSANEEPIDFNKEFIKIDKDLVTSNLLVEDRFGKLSKLLLMPKTPLISRVDDFLNEFYQQNKLTDHLISGPSGGGKSFAILTHVLKKRRSNEKILILYMNLNHEYIRNLPRFLFNDLVYGFYPFLQHKAFPACPGLNKDTRTGFPLQDWLILLSQNLQSRQQNCLLFSQFFEAAIIFCNEMKIQFVAGVDQTNYIQTFRAKLMDCEYTLLTGIINGKFSHKTFSSSSDNNDDLDVSFSSLSLENQIFKTGQIGKFNKDQLILFLKELCNLDYDDAPDVVLGNSQEELKENDAVYNESQLEKLMDITGLIPLEIWEFCQCFGKNFEEKFTKYREIRTNQISKKFPCFTTGRL